MPPRDWLEACHSFFKLETLKTIDEKITNASCITYPTKPFVFKAFEMTPFEDVKVVVIGQDPYHGEGEACGLAFAVPAGVKMPPSLKNLAKELKNDLGQELKSSDLNFWAAQGVLLLNRTLSVAKDKPLSHKHVGWDDFTCAVIRALIASKKSLVFVSFGKESFNFLKVFMPLMGANQAVLNFAHPSPLSAYRGFFGSKPFSQINEKLVSMGQKAVVFGAS
jgi:uracil-DNA glycosylase